MMLNRVAMRVARIRYFTSLAVQHKLSSGRSWGAGDLGGIAGLMVLDLETQELVNGGNGVGVFGCNADARAMLGVFELVLDGFAQPLHGLRARRILGVN